ncbi:type IV pilus assembly protein PilF [Acinetobacter calcoaceticus]|uniref:Type IV pilus assembly protein PilF n=1 Tax=Acinetobacter calcoaceticus TaxID=471 RepID=A0A4R1XJP8_ACICA|nr:type IV pilus assembly protein PilF [Acinetobacter calcoaceticus]
MAVWSISGCQSSATDTLVKKDPQRGVKARSQLAAEYIRLGDLDAAKRALDQALAFDSHDSNANMLMGVLLQQEGSPENLQLAERYFKRAIASDAKNAQARNNYATYLYQLKRYDDAVVQLKVAGAALGYDQRYRALENLGQVYLSLGDQAQAKTTFEQALHVNRESTLSRLALAEIYYTQQDFKAATQFYEQYVHLIGHNNRGANALWLEARLARAHGDQMDMQQQLNQLQAQFPDSQEYKRYMQLQHSTEAVWK